MGEILEGAGRCLSIIKGQYSLRTLNMKFLTALRNSFRRENLGIEAEISKSQRGKTLSFNEVFNNYLKISLSFTQIFLYNETSLSLPHQLFQRPTIDLSN